MKRKFYGLALWLAGLCTQLSAQAQEWPRQPLRIVVGYAPGGPVDALARLVAPALKDAFGQPVVVENKPGANGNLGGEFVARSSTDGHTFLMSPGSLVSISPHLYPRMAFDPSRDLVPVAAVARVPFYLVVRNESPIKDVRELMADLKAHPTARSFGSPGNGSSPHLAAELLNMEVGAGAVHVPYKGAAPALADLLAGQLDFLFDPGNSIPRVKAGKLRMLAVGSLRRTPQMPGVPTLDELGLKGFDADAVFGLYAPAGTPAEVVARVHAAVGKAVRTPAVREAILASGIVPVEMSPAEFGHKGAADSRRMGDVIRSRGIRLD